jgi:hypothetical protein
MMAGIGNSNTHRTIIVATGRRTKRKVRRRTRSRSRNRNHLYNVETVFDELESPGSKREHARRSHCHFLEIHRLLHLSMDRKSHQSQKIQKMMTGAINGKLTVHNLQKQTLGKADTGIMAGGEIRTQVKPQHARPTTNIQSEMSARLLHHPGDTDMLKFGKQQPIASRRAVSLGNYVRQAIGVEARNRFESTLSRRSGNK